MRKSLSPIVFLIVITGLAYSGTPTIPANGIYTPSEYIVDGITVSQAPDIDLDIVMVDYNYQRGELRLFKGENRQLNGKPLNISRHHCLIQKIDGGRKAIARDEPFIYMLWFDEDADEFFFSVTSAANGRSYTVKMELSAN